MSVDIDAVNERLNGLVSLLKAVGVDGIGSEKGGTSSKGGLPDARQLDDEQIEAIIKKLQLAQSEAPQIIAALEAQAASNKKLQKSRQPQEPPEHKIDHDDDDDDDDDSYDEDANYPMVGPGCSDDCSVVSDLTTPTVLAGVPVPDEEHYRDTLPPMIVGGAIGGKDMLIAPTKRKNLVGAVKPGVLVPPPRRNKTTLTTGGAAAQRRKHYNATMEKLAHEGTAPRKQRSIENKNSSSHAKSKESNGKPQKSASNGSTNSGGKITKKHSKVSRRASTGHGEEMAEWNISKETDSSWNAFNDPAATRSSHKKVAAPVATLIDDDGFLMADSMDANFDPFGDFGNNAFHDEQPKARKTKKSSENSSRSGEKSSKPVESSTGIVLDGKTRRSRRASCL